MIPQNRNGEVWVYAEQEDGGLSDVPLELCGRAREPYCTLSMRSMPVRARAATERWMWITRSSS